MTFSNQVDKVVLKLCWTHRRFIASSSVLGWSLLLQMMRSPDDVIQNIKRALHNTHTTSQSVIISLQHPETLNIPMGHLEGFIQNRINLLLIFFQPQELLLPLGTNYKFLSFHAHTSNPWICSFSVAPPHFVSLATDHSIRIPAAVVIRIGLQLRSFYPGL